MKKRYFFLAALFLFNPIVSIFDIFPDFIGYFLIMKAFSEASYVFDNADETKSAFKTMAIISIFKLVCLVILPFTDATMALVFSFTFAIIEIIYGIGAYRMLFDTTSFICMRCGADDNVSECEGLKKFSIFFFITRIVCATAPDLFALFLSDPQKAWMYRFRTLFFILLTVFAFVVGIIWLVRVIKFFKKALSDEIKQKIKLDFEEEMKDRQSVFFSKDFMLAISIISISMIFSIDFYIDKIEILSDILLAPILFISFFILVKKGYIQLKLYEKFVFATLAIHFVSSILNTIFTLRFTNEYIFSNVIRNENARKMYLPVQIFTCLEAISFFALVLLCLYLLRKYAIKRVEENPKFFAEHSIDGFLKDFSLATKKRGIIALIFGAVSAISSIAYCFVVPYVSEYTVFNTLLSLLFVVVFSITLSYISTEVFKKIFKYS